MKQSILVCGVGGQGTVLASKLLAQAALRLGQPVKTCETIGMAQRGGSVTSHVRIGQAHSPLIPRARRTSSCALSRAKPCATCPTCAGTAC